MFEGFAQHRIDADGTEINLRTGGEGPPLLLLHGYPQTHVAWHSIAPVLARHFTVVVPDLRGYGDSAKPPGGPRHSAYAKRALAVDQVRVMEELGFSRFRVAGHDRGARVTHRLCLDHPERVERAAVLDILPTTTVYEQTDMVMATAYFHWFFLIQPFDLPERLIGADPDHWFDKIVHLRPGGEPFDPLALAEYKRCFRDPATIHATCEDYRAGATIDLEHDALSKGRKIECPLLVLWGEDGFVGRRYDPLAEWRLHARDVRGAALRGGHFFLDESPEETLDALLPFMLG
ncbi:alpha/beta fold hydrolase [Streptomyces massasporeus]|uniref:Alpha/beta fold hydrolase n=1 Tax=Streptomyces massasporeus TaxID=67324 RepID=A0ABW6LRD0_9ACTN